MCSKSDLDFVLLLVDHREIPNFNLLRAYKTAILRRLIASEHLSAIRTSAIVFPKGLVKLNANEGTLLTWCEIF